METKRDAIVHFFFTSINDGMKDIGGIIAVTGIEWT